MFEDILVVLAGYLIGSVSTAVIVGRLMGTADPRSEGSRNPGATNMLRLGGKKAGALTLIGDMLKGVVAVLLARLLDASVTVQAASAVAAFLGHLYPLYFGFKGGKGVATALGVMLGLCWPAGLATVLTWLVVASLFRISSLAALVAVALAPAYFWWLRPEPSFLIALIGMAIMLYWRHRENIRNLIAGTEGKIGLGSEED
jgi:glycerol-3-phosphate acyltransferase PlsY